ncbi:MAG: hypothetical protein H6883_13645 [Rhodobiaceae bacterium]|nr:hypothetical protein [Rhodobiaceae bacterium]
MRMEVAVARAGDWPRLLLNDEPFAALDELTRTKLDEDLRQVIERSGIAAYSSPTRSRRPVFLSDRVLILNSRPARITGRIENSVFTWGTGPQALNSFNQMCRKISKAVRMTGNKSAAWNGAGAFRTRAERIAEPKPRCA